MCNILTSGDVDVVRSPQFRPLQQFDLNISTFVEKVSTSVITQTPSTVVVSGRTTDDAASMLVNLCVTNVIAQAPSTEVVSDDTNNDDVVSMRAKRRVVDQTPSAEVVSDVMTTRVSSMRTKRCVASVLMRVDVPCKKPKTNCSPSELIVGMDIKDMPVVGYGRFCGKLVHVCASKCVVEWSDNTKGEYSRTHIAKYAVSN
jgi:hypothetical protein